MIHPHVKVTTAILAVLSFALASCAGGSNSSVPVAGGAANVASAAAGILPGLSRRSPHCSAPISVSEAFAPNRLRVATETLLTVTLSNPCTSSGQWKFNFTDTLPSELLGATFVSSTCGVTTYPYSVLYGGTFHAYSNEDLPASASCSMTWMITSHDVGTWINAIPANAAGVASTAATAAVTFTLTAPGTTPGPIHTP